jgi:hypothetical protein
MGADAVPTDARPQRPGRPWCLGAALGAAPTLLALAVAVGGALAGGAAAAPEPDLVAFARAFNAA